MFYTLGQRQGLGIGGLKNYSDAPWFVAEKCLETNDLVVVQGTNHPKLLAKGLTARQNQLDWRASDPPGRFTAKVRYRAPDAPCTIEMQGSDLHNLCATGTCSHTRTVGCNLRW